MNNKEKILLATLELATEKGLGAVSMSQIAQKVGVQKATLYSHFTSKEEIISCLYSYLRDQAMSANGITQVDYGEFVKGKQAKEVLLSVVESYQKMNQEPKMYAFYKFIASERVLNPEAAKIMIQETERMIVATKQLFYAMQIHQIMKFENIDIAAFSFAMTIHAMLDYNGDKILAGEPNIEEQIRDYITEFCK